MSTAAKVGLWVAAAAGVLYLAFEPSRGLLNQGPMAATGIMLIAAGFCRQFFATREPTESPAAVRRGR